MRIALRLDWREWLVFGPGEATAILTAIPFAERMTEENDKFTRLENEKWLPTIRLVPEEMIGKPDPLELRLREQVKAGEDQWIRYYNKFTEAEKKLVDLQATIDSFKKSLGGE
jgi:hypothetical protein